MTHVAICYSVFCFVWILVLLDSMHTDWRDMEEAVNRGSLVPYTNNYCPKYVVQNINPRKLCDE